MQITNRQIRQFTITGARIKPNIGIYTPLTTYIYGDYTVFDGSIWRVKKGYTIPSVNEGDMSNAPGAHEGWEKISKLYMITAAGISELRSKSFDDDTVAILYNDKTMYIFNSQSSENDNNDTVIKPDNIDASESGRWIKLIDFDHVRYADQLYNPRTITFIGDVTGSFVFDGSQDVSVNIEVLSGEIQLDTSNFDNILSSEDDTVQKALDTLDDHIHNEITEGDNLAYALDNIHEYEYGSKSSIIHTVKFIAPKDETYTIFTLYAAEETDIYVDVVLNPVVDKPYGENIDYTLYSFEVDHRYQFHITRDRNDLVIDVPVTAGDVVAFFIYKKDKYFYEKDSLALQVRNRIDNDEANLDLNDGLKYKLNTGYDNNVRCAIGVREHYYIKVDNGILETNTRSGFIQDFVDEVNNKADKIENGVNGDIVIITSDGNIADSGKKLTDYTPVGHHHYASEIFIDDTKDNFTSNNVEGALEELGEEHAFMNGFDRYNPDSMPDISFYQPGKYVEIRLKEGQTEFYYWAEGKKIVKTTNEGKTIPNETGVYYIYYDASGALHVINSENFNYDIIYKYALVALVYYNAVEGSYIFADERHGVRMSPATHVYNHKTFGTRYESGLDITGIANGSDTFATINSGAIWDEDIRHEIQQYTEAPFAYRIGPEGRWVITPADNKLAYKEPGNTYASWNKFDTTTNEWILQEGESDSDFFITFFVAIPNLAGQAVFKIIGQNAYGTRSEARDAIETEINRLVLGKLPSEEFKFLYAMIVKRNGNLVKLADGSLYVDLRELRGGTGSGSVASNIAGDISTDTTNFDNILSSSDTNVQQALDTLDDHNHDDRYYTKTESDNSYEKVANKNQANGYAGLDGNAKIPTNLLPSLAITETYTATSESEQLSLTVQKGDVCVRTDLNKSYINVSGNNSSMSDWQELLTPTDAVTSVDGRTGAVNLEDKYVQKGEITEISYISTDGLIINLNTDTEIGLSSTNYVETDYTLNSDFNKITISAGGPNVTMSGTVTVKQGSTTIATKTFNETSPSSANAEGKYEIEIIFDDLISAGTYTLRLDFDSPTNAHLQKSSGYVTYHDANGYSNPLTDASWVMAFYGPSVTVKVSVDNTGVHVTDSVNGDIPNLVQEINSKVDAADIADKADKVSNATAGNFASLDSSGNLADSGKNANSFADKNHTHTVSEITDIANAHVSYADNAGDADTLDGIDSTGFLRKAEDEYVYGLVYRGAIGDGKDLNTFTQPGIYVQGSNSWAANGSNYPIRYGDTDPVGGVLIVYGNGFIHQEYHTYGWRNTIFHRTYYSSEGWSPWKQVITSHDNQKIYGYVKITGSNGDAIEFRNDNNVANTLDIYFSAKGGFYAEQDLYIASGYGNIKFRNSYNTSSGKDFISMYYNGDNPYIGFSYSSGITEYHTDRITGNGSNFSFSFNVLPTQDNSRSLGSSSYRWKDVWAVDASINSSDARLKKVYDITEVEKKVAAELKTKITKYKWLDAIEGKGEDKARYHVGILAQEVEEVFKKYGLNPEEYGMFCYDEWYETEDGDVVPDNANIDTERMVWIKEDGTEVTIVEKDRYSLRYTELMLFILKSM